MKIIQLVVLPRERMDYEERTTYAEHTLLGLDEEGGVWERGDNGWEQHTAPELDSTGCAEKGTPWTATK